MADLSEFEQLAKAHPPNRKPCPVPAVRGSLKGDVLASFNQALAASKWDIPSSAVARWCEIRGLKVTHQNITAHRSGKCQCARTPNG